MYVCRIKWIKIITLKPGRTNALCQPAFLQDTIALKFIWMFPLSWQTGILSAIPQHFGGELVAMLESFILLLACLWNHS